MKVPGVYGESIDTPEVRLESDLIVLNYFNNSLNKDPSP